MITLAFEYNASKENSKLVLNVKRLFFSERSEDSSFVHVNRNKLILTDLFIISVIKLDIVVSRNNLFVFLLLFVGFFLELFS